MALPMRSRLVVAFKGIKFIVELVHDLILLVLDEFQLESSVDALRHNGTDRRNFIQRGCHAE